MRQIHANYLGKRCGFVLRVDRLGSSLMYVFALPRVRRIVVAGFFSGGGDGVGAGWINGPGIDFPGMTVICFRSIRQFQRKRRPAGVLTM